METRRFARRKRMLEEGRMLVTDDRFSNLPEHIIDNIVSRQPSRSIAWMSTLSKKWFYLIVTLPVLFFEEQEFDDSSYRRKDKRLRQFMERYLEHQKLIPIQKIRIGTSCIQDSKINPKLFKFTDLVLSDKIRELYLMFRHIPKIHEAHCHCYALPSRIFSHGVYLTVLELVGCRFGNLDAVNVPFLKTVSLKYVCILGEGLSKLVSSSLSLESLALKHCHGFKMFRIFNPSLLKFVVKNCKDIERFSLNCPRLQYLKFVGREIHDDGSNQSFSEFWISCCDLKDVCFAKLSLGTEAFDNIFSISPHLQSLIMSLCIVEGRLKLPPKKLKYLAIHYTYFPRLLCLSAVESLSYTGFSGFNIECPKNYLMFFSPLINFSELKSLDLRWDFPNSSKSLESILSRCPHLHSLYLSCSWNSCNFFRIVSSSLKILSITAIPVMIEFECAIEAPNLVYFEYEGPRLRISDDVASHELVVIKLKFNELFDVCDPYISLWCHYFLRFREAKLIILSDLLHECLYTPTQIAFPPNSYGYSGQMEINVRLMELSYEEWIANLINGYFYPTSLSLRFWPGGPPLSPEPSALIDLKFDYDFLDGLTQFMDYDRPWLGVCEANIKILENPGHALSLIKTLIVEASNLIHLAVQFGDEVSEEMRESINSAIAGIVSDNNGLQFPIHLSM